MNILEEANKLTNSDREKDYGHPKLFFDDVAGMWTIQLEEYLKPGVKLPGFIIWELMTSYKLVREKRHKKRDNKVDIAGYARTGEKYEEL